jgi:hypothetical protein
MKRDLYSEVSASIIAELEAGSAPWIKPWSATPGANTPCNAVTNRPYSGCNVVLLWMAQAAGYRGIDVVAIERTEMAAAASGEAAGFLALDRCAGSPLDELARRSFQLRAARPDEIAGDWATSA